MAQTRENETRRCIRGAGQPCGVRGGLLEQWGAEALKVDVVTNWREKDGCVPLSRTENTGAQRKVPESHHLSLLHPHTLGMYF